MVPMPFSPGSGHHPQLDLGKAQDLWPESQRIQKEPNLGSIMGFWKWVRVYNKDRACNLELYVTAPARKEGCSPGSRRRPNLGSIMGFWKWVRV